jgi:hypothetical protein
VGGVEVQASVRFRNGSKYAGRFRNGPNRTQTQCLFLSELVKQPSKLSVASDGTLGER